ncbi:hypothetical protein SK128_012580 [Halocaridina rubra]|uniref:Neurotransmitter-gated ion-channel transmembrane domain-containing protein n=1 Tax=Halocaridina rubra TaxID=373956 RepID=A0AAN8WE36_HALRR
MRDSGIKFFNRMAWIFTEPQTSRSPLSNPERQSGGQDDPTDSVWTPRIELVNADFPNIYTTAAILNILRKSEPEDDDPSRISRDEVYEGAKNPLRLTQKYNAPFSCAMDMQGFPFDTQRCYLYIRISSAKMEFLEWGELVAKYLGEVILAEYEVGRIGIDKIFEEDYSMAIVSITFSRRYAYYLTSAYLPTIMLMIISYASLFCKRENCDLRVMMALTTLLVLYALYQQISNDLPRTSYTKAIDVWCFFALTFIFTQVILHVMINVDIKHSMGRVCPCSASSKVGRPREEENLPLDQQGHRKISYNVKEGNSVNMESEPKHITRNHGKDPSCRVDALLVARIFYLVLFITFCVVYWIVVLNNE